MRVDEDGAYEQQRLMRMEEEQTYDEQRFERIKGEEVSDQDQPLWFDEERAYDLQG